MNYKYLPELIEIFQGYTRFDFQGQTLFFKHFSIFEQNQISFFYEKYKNIALQKGVELEKDIYDRLLQEKDWTSEDDLKIVQQQDFVNNLIKTKANLHLPSQKENHQKTIDEEQLKLNILLARKQELVGTSAEQYGIKMSNEEFIRTLIYKDEDLRNLKFDENSFGELSSTDLAFLVKNYSDISEKFSEENIQHIVLQDFFNMYMSCCENPYQFYGKPIINLSAYQMKLVLYGRVFSNIFSYNDDIPEYIRKDPKQIFEFIETKKTREQFQSQHGDKQASMVFGATSKDLDVLDPSAKKISLNDMIAQNGGSLSMEQMMDMMG